MWRVAVVGNSAVLEDRSRSETAESQGVLSEVVQSCLSEILYQFVFVPMVDKNAHFPTFSVTLNVIKL